jgi:hypothetical protein
LSLVVKYISFGKYETGGYKHEVFFAQQLAKLFTLKDKKCKLIIERPNRFFKNPFAYLKLFLLGLKANANYNVVVARVAVFAVLCNLFSKNILFIVLHNFDEQDGKSVWLKWYYKILFFLLKYVARKNVSIVAVAPFWVNFFSKKVNQHVKVHLFPNFFDDALYENVNEQIINKQNQKQIHLGQWSFKNHCDIFEIAKQLTEKGYYCYFSTNYAVFAKRSSNYEVVYFEHFDSYLLQMAISKYTLALTAINEGWNRVAHESILVGTPVIAYAKAGLLDLVKESKSVSANNLSEVMQAVENGKVRANPILLAHYYEQNCQKYLNKILY